jgi:transposase-like protein
LLGHDQPLTNLTLRGASKSSQKPRCRRLKGAPVPDTLATEKPAVFGMIQRTGEIVIRMPDNVQQATIKPLILQTIMLGAPIYTDGYNIYSRLEACGYAHKTVNHSARECASYKEMATDSAKFMNTMEASGRSCAPGYARTKAYHKSSPCT